MLTWSKLKKVQPVTSKILMNSFQKNRLSHAYLIQGQRGTGKKQIATLIAMTIFCTDKDGIEPCQSCHMCKRILSKITLMYIGSNQMDSRSKKNK